MAGACLGRSNGLIVVQCLDDILYCLAIKVRQIQTDIIQFSICIDTSGQGRPDHTSQQLGDVSKVVCSPEGHHCFRSRAIPSCIQVHFEENKINPIIFFNTRCFNRADIDAPNGKHTLIMEGVDNLIISQGSTERFLNYVHASAKICLCDFAVISIFDLHNQDGFDHPVALLFTVTLPMTAFILPVQDRLPEHGHVRAEFNLRIMDDDSVFEQAGFTHIIHGNSHFLHH